MCRSECPMTDPTGDSVVVPKRWVDEVVIALDSASVIGARSCRPGDGLDLGNHDRLTREAKEAGWRTSDEHTRLMEYVRLLERGMGAHEARVEAWRDKADDWEDDADRQVTQQNDGTEGK